MNAKIQILALAFAVFAAVVVADSDEKQAPTQYQAKPAYAPKPRYGSGERDNAKYSFAYQVKAGGARSYGGDDSDSKEGYGKSYDKTVEFGHAETRDYGKTTGKYFVELPDGRLQTVEYVVDGDSGYVAKVSYSGAEKPVYGKN